MKKNQQSLLKLNDHFEMVVPAKLEPNKESERCKDLAAKLKQQYFGNDKISFDVIQKYLQVCFKLRVLATFCYNLI